MKSETYLAFDYGSKYIGIAVGHSATRLAHALETVRVHGQRPEWDRIARVIDEWRPRALVVGLPLNMDDTANAMTASAKKFGEGLRGRYNLPIHWVDERLTSVAAREALIEAGAGLRHQRKQVDAIAAQTILQAFLDERREEPRDQP